MLELQSQGSLEGFSMANGFLFRALVYLGFGYHQGAGATELIVIFNPDDASFLGC